MQRFVYSAQKQLWSLQYFLDLFCMRGEILNQWMASSSSSRRWTRRRVACKQYRDRACATTRRAPTRSPPDRPSRNEFFRFSACRCASRGDGISRFDRFCACIRQSHTSDQTCWFRECMTDYVAVSSPRVIKIRKHPGTARIIQL